MASPGKILIVEDEGMIRRALVDRFVNEGFDVDQARNGLEGLDKTVNSYPHPDIILLDVIMPEMDGITMSEKVEADPEISHIPIIFLTNISDSREVRDKIKKSDYEFLVKSNWDIEKVVEKVRERMNRT